MTFKLHYLKNGQQATEEFDTLHTAVNWAETRLETPWCVVGPGDSDYPHFIYFKVILGELAINFADDTDVEVMIEELIED